MLTSIEREDLCKQLMRSIRTEYDRELCSALAALVERGQVRPDWLEYDDEALKVWVIVNKDREFYQQLTNMNYEIVAAAFNLFGNGKVSFCFLRGGEVTWHARQEV